MINRRFLPAAGWMLAGAALSFLGVIHAYNLNSAGVVNKVGIFVAPEFTVSYAAAAVFLAACHFYNRRFPSILQTSELSDSVDGTASHATAFVSERSE
jgi:hypothetical protein